MTLRVLDLFSGIGGFSLGLERTGGFRTVAFCEIEPFCQRVLAKHWPGVPIYDDIRTLTATRLAADGIGIDVICGGFPCQDISHAGKGAGITGERSGLWRDYARLVGELRPRYVIVENVSALLGRGIGDVLGDLAEIGYDAEWHCIPASAVGAPHRRDRVWIVAHADSRRCKSKRIEEHCKQQGARRNQFDRLCARRPWSRPDVAHASRERWPVHDGQDFAEFSAPLRPWLLRGISDGERVEIWNGGESALDRVVDGVSAGMDGSVRSRLKALGNAVVPQIPELIGRAILQAESASKILDNTRANSCVNCVS